MFIKSSNLKLWTRPTTSHPKLTSYNLQEFVRISKFKLFHDIIIHSLRFKMIVVLTHKICFKIAVVLTFQYSNDFTIFTIVSFN